MASERRAYVKIPLPVFRLGLSNDDLATLVRLQLCVSERWSTGRLHSSELDGLRLTNAEVMEVAGVTTLKHARRRLRVLLTVLGASSLCLHEEDGGVRFSWRAFVDYQGFAKREDARNPGDSSGQVRASATATATATAQKRKKGSVRGARKPAAPEPTTAPDHLDAEGHARVVEWIGEMLPRKADRADAVIEEAIDFARATGKRFVDWPQAIINSLRNRENAVRAREGHPPLRTLEQERAIRRAAAEMRARNAAARAEEAQRMEAAP